MTDRRLTETIDGLAAALAPVRRLPRPSRLALAWGVGAAVLAGVVYAFLGNGFLGMGRSWVLVALIGSVLTAASAAVAAFSLSLPDRSDAWAYVPLPPAVLWVVSTILGCIAGVADGGAWGTTAEEVRTCLTVIVTASVPLSALLIVMLRRARPLRHTGVALMAGLASAAAAASVLLLINPHNSTVLDVAIHTACIAAVVSLSGLIGSRVLRS